MSILKKAYARGVTESLITSGHVKVASLEDAEKIADAIGERILFDPTQPVAPAHCLEVAEAIIKEAMSPTGSLITGDKPEQANSPVNAATQVGALGAMDEADRPQETYHEGAGMTAQPTEMVGLEMAHPKAPGKTDSAPNSVNKAASLADIIRKVAGDTGALITGDKEDQKNTPAAAASQVGGLGALDEKQRPQGTHLVGAGNTELNHPAEATVGTEKQHPKAPGNTDASTTNSAKELSKTSAYAQLFEQTAQKVAARLPTKLSDETKVAAVKRMMGMDEQEQVAFLSQMEKGAESLGLPMPLEAKKDKDEEDKEDDKKEKKDKKDDKEEKKEASARPDMHNVANLLSEIAKIANVAARQ